MSLHLTITCPDRTGIVAAVSGYIAERNGWITEADHYADPETGWFFMRNAIRADSLSVGIDDFRSGFATLADELKLDWRLSDSAAPKKVVVLASREAHCVADILYRWRSGDLTADIVSLVSNHPDLADYADWHGVPFHHVPVDNENRAAHFRQIEGLIEGADVIVLARYMQVLPAALCERFTGRIINIHHSFLPAFAGAGPYRQAYTRGVKLIGATCHYATAELDAGPIIEQDVVRVTHHHGVEDLKRLGRDVERQVLSRGLRYHLEDRVLLHGQKTVVFA